MTIKLKYFVGNWKMFGDFSDFKIVSKINDFNRKSKRLFKKKKIILCVPSTLIHYFKNKLTLKSISLGAQNCDQYKDYGSFTGSINASMLKRAGAEFIILGHSENRAEGESDKSIKQKIINSLDKNLTVILCIGETLSQKRNKKTFSVIKNELKKSLDKKFAKQNILIAYEPIWSIGTNKIPKISELELIIKFIKKEFKNIFKTQKDPNVLYGGSVKPNNISLFSSISEIDGFLIGGASQSPKKFIDIVKNYYK